MKCDRLISDQDISVVVSGPIYKGQTEETFKSIRRILPKAEIVFSTWRGINVSGLDIDEVVYNDDPGNFEMLSENNTVSYNNLNRQIVSTKTGIERASRRFVLKLRADSILTGTRFLKAWGGIRPMTGITNFSTPEWFAVEPGMNQQDCGILSICVTGIFLGTKKMFMTYGIFHF